MRVGFIVAEGGLGGAPTATRRWVEALREGGIDARLVVLGRSWQEGSQIIRLNSYKGLRNASRYIICKFLNKLLALLWIRRSRRSMYYLYRQRVKVDLTGFDILVIAWGQYLDLTHIRERFTGRIWYLFHDMWYLTGGCAYSGSCTNYFSGCSECPDVKTNGAKRWIQRQKRKKHEELETNVGCVVLTTSEWMRKKARSIHGSIKHTMVANPIPGIYGEVLPKWNELVKLRDVVACRHRVLFIGNTNDGRKGFDDLIKVIDELSDREAKDFCLIVIGNANVRQEYTSLKRIKVVGFGTTSDYAFQARVIAGSTCLVCLSTEDNSPNVVAEALMCGTPVIAWEDTGASEMIENRRSGYIVPLAKHSSALESVLACSDFGIEKRESIRQAAATIYSYRSVYNRFTEVVEECGVMS